MLIRNGRVAEWSLSLVSTRDHAAATVGDLVESGVGGWRLWWAVGSQVARAVPLALTAFVAQFVIFGLQARIVLGSIVPGYALHGFRWYAGLSCFATQVLVGYGIARYGKTRAAGVCLMVVLADFALGALNVNNANINMAIWAVPLLASTTLALRYARRRGLSRRA